MSIHGLVPIIFIAQLKVNAEFVQSKPLDKTTSKKEKCGLDNTNKADPSPSGFWTSFNSFTSFNPFKLPQQQEPFILQPEQEQRN